jgi:hypothetical protein
MTFLEFMECCLKVLKSPEVEIIFNTAWMLRRARNELLWEGSLSNVEDICFRAVVGAVEYLEVGIRDGGVSVHAQIGERQQIIWIPPSIGSYKVSIACHTQSGSPRVGVGILIRDHMGLVAVASGFVSSRFSESLLIHSLAVFHALQLAFETGFRHSLVLEVPCRELVNLLQRKSFSLA